MALIYISFIKFITLFYNSNIKEYLTNSIGSQSTRFRGDHTQISCLFHELSAQRSSGCFHNPHGNFSAYDF